MAWAKMVLAKEKGIITKGTPPLKVVGETLGRYYSDQFGLSFIAIRLGGVNEPDRPNMRRQFPCAPKPPAPFLAATWVLPEPRAAPAAGAGWRRTTGTHFTTPSCGSNLKPASTTASSSGLLCCAWSQRVADRPVHLCPSHPPLRQLQRHLQQRHKVARHFAHH